MKNNVNGFTLLEAVILLVVISILALTIFARTPKPSSANVITQAKLLGNDLRYAQSLAMTRGSRYYVIGINGNGYQIRDNNNIPIILPSGKTQVVFNSPIVFGSVTNLPNNLVAFNARGTPFIDPTLPGTRLISPATITITDGVQSASIIITPETGAIQVQ